MRMKKAHRKKRSVLESLSEREFARVKPVSPEAIHRALERGKKARMVAEKRARRVRTNSRILFR
jgi:hypothetical protein